MDPLVVLFGLGVGILIGLTGATVVLALVAGALIVVSLAVLAQALFARWAIVGIPPAVGASAWLVHRIQFGKAPVAAWARTS
jgi:hypothetical protein